ncbi:MAG: hypothetical protein JXB19_01800 [Bacteroidales bacterium]|nr:hypothetical protein [Bacteroidales bacterium]
MEPLIVITEERLEALILSAIQKSKILQQPEKEKLPVNINADEARDLLQKTWGSPVSKSLFYKLSMVEMPKQKIGRRLVFNRSELINYAQSKIKKTGDPVSKSVMKSAKNKLNIKL